jgi:hypothetical protein
MDLSKEGTTMNKLSESKEWKDNTKATLVAGLRYEKEKLLAVIEAKEQLGQDSSAEKRRLQEVEQQIKEATAE